ncbi:Aerobactin synthase IucA [Serratia rubidaea]|uniref:Aerobactin synthase IucA n=1 Tax=Serratia rubidaea TaxID=61652 RepID=A0A4U9HA77_SERRU|nr:Aerobactin synthase IucA [Serratia rubidaea]
MFSQRINARNRDWQVIPATDHQQHPQLHIPLNQHQAIRINLRYTSPTQHHHYLFPATLHQSDDGQATTLSVEQLVDLLLAKPAVKGELNDQTVALFRQRVLESHDNTQQAIAVRLDWPTLRDRPLNFAEAEQGLLVGHAFHPAPKSHEPFNPQQARRYLPDFGARFPLRWFCRR